MVVAMCTSRILNLCHSLSNFNRNGWFPHHSFSQNRRESHFPTPIGTDSRKGKVNFQGLPKAPLAADIESKPF